MHHPNFHLKNIVKCIVFFQRLSGKSSREGFKKMQNIGGQAPGRIDIAHAGTHLEAPHI